MIRIILALILASLSGCSTTGTLDNLLACTVAGDKAIVASMYGPIGVASKIRTADAEVVCSKTGPAK